MQKRAMWLASSSLVLFLMVGCGSDSSSNPASPTNSSPLVGTWNKTKEITSHATGSKDTVASSATNSTQYVFSANYQLTQTIVAFGSSSTFTGTWSATADSVTITTMLSGATKYKFSISGKDLDLVWGFSVGTDNGVITEKYTKQ
jgi:hypothetical protein